MGPKDDSTTTSTFSGIASEAANLAIPGGGLGLDDLVVLASVLAALHHHAPDDGRVEISGGEMAEGWEDVVFEFIADPCASDLGRVTWKLEGSGSMQNVLRLLRAQNFADISVTRGSTPMPYSQTSAELRATTRIADDQLGELRELGSYVVLSESPPSK